MSKAKDQDSTNNQLDRSTVARRDRMLAKLEKHFAIGRTAHEGGSKVIGSLAEKHGMSESSIHKMRHFFREYGSPEKFKRLLARRRPNGMPIHWGYVPYLLTLSETHRERYEQLIEKKGWTAPELYAAIGAEFGRHQRGGRPPKTSQDPLIELELCLPQARRFIDRCQAACEKLEKRRATRGDRLVGLKKLADDLAAAAKKVNEAVNQLPASGSVPQSSKARPARPPSSQPSRGARRN